MKKIISFILAITMLTALIPSAFATGEEASETQNLTIKYDIGTVVKNNTISALSALTEQTSNGFFKSNSDSSSTGLTFYNTRGTNANNGIDISSESYVTLDVYVPVEGLYTISGNHPHFANGGVITVYVNGSGNEDMVGSYDSSPASSNITSGYQGTDKSYNNDEEFNFKNVSFNEGWNSIKFVAADPANPAEKTIYKGTLRTFTLTLGDGSGYALMGLREAELTVGDESANTYTIKTFNSSTAAEITADLTHTSANTNIATVADGVITAVGGGVTTVTVSDGTGLSYDITVTVNDPTMPTILYDIQTVISTWKDSSSGDKYVKDFTEAVTNGFLKNNSGSTKTDKLQLRSKENCEITFTSTQYVVLDLYVPVSGYYVMEMKYPKWKSGAIAYVYADVDGNWKEIGSYDCSGTANNTYTDQTWPLFTSNSIELKKGWNSFKFASALTGNGAIKNITLSAGTGDALMGVDEKEITIGTTDTVNAYLSSTGEAITENITYTSDNASVATVDGNTVTAVGYGEANITAAYSGDIVGANTITTKVSVKDAKTNTVNVAIDDDGDGVATIQSATLGDSVTAIANVPNNKVFRGWVRGSADNGRLVSTDAEYPFTATTHIYLTAIYSDEPTAATNEYYHFNGEFLGTSEPTEEPTLVGYTFAKEWTDAGTDGLITRLIAKFNKNADEYTVTNSDAFTMTKDDSKYDTEVTCSSESAVYWYRDNRLVDYGTEYKFFIWGNTTVTTSAEGHNGAKLMLDVKKDNSYMVEYDAGSATLLEVGILFGADGETPTVESCREKMSSQRNLNEAGHGQFSATSEYPVARGYLIYNDNGTYRVIYAD